MLCVFAPLVKVSALLSKDPRRQYGAVAMEMGEEMPVPSL
jgi:deoxycytidylate deaminase